MDPREVASLLKLPPVRKITARAVKARAMQFRYHDDPGATFRLASIIETTLGVKISRSYDPQSGTGYHLRREFESKFLSDGDWIVVDVFGKQDVMKDKDLNVYYEPEM